METIEYYKVFIINFVWKNYRYNIQFLQFFQIVYILILKLMENIQNIDK